jgi:hypothetical protein
MNNQKDTKKTDLNSYKQDNFVGVNALINRPASPFASQGGPVYEFANKKTEKLVTALYMVTDCIEKDDALKEKLRLLGVQLLSDIYELSLPKQGFGENTIRISLNHIYEILSFIEIANTIGYISEMNTNILKKEFNLLMAELNSHLPKEKHFSFTLDEKMFNLPPEVSKTESLSFNRNIVKRTDSMSFINNRTSNNSVLYKPLPTVDYKKIKSERVEKIISIIKDKESSLTGEAGASIKDISSAFTNCSEKTIQRELNDLIGKGQVKKTGDKRWSRYSIIVASSM